MAMRKVTAEDLDTIFLGSGALEYPWYGDDVIKSGGTGWVLRFTVDLDEALYPGEIYEINDFDLLAAVRRIAANKEVLDVGSNVRKQCQALIFKGTEEVDFDADLADQVIQVAAFGEVHY